MSEIIKVRHLKKYFNEMKAVDDISFSVNKGEMFGFLGANGAGKTTTINVLCTLLSSTEGEVEIGGFRLGKENEKIKKHIGVVYQDNCLDDILTVQQNLLLRGGLYETNPKVLHGNLEWVCEILDVKDLLHRRYGKLSGGQKRRCEIARALMHTPDILFLDEPTTGLDPVSRKSVWETIHKLQKEMGMTVFLTTHYMEEAAQSEHIGIMKQGHLIEYGTPFELKERYAKDKLSLIPQWGKEEEILKQLNRLGMVYQRKQNGIHVRIDSTMATIPVIETVKELINGFEVIQGNMDDVFVNATQGGEGL